MRATQQIFRVRRQYNQWVANQTLEDYALRFTAKTARRWSAKQVALTALGATAFMALEAIGGAITLNYGFFNAFIAMLTVGLVIFVTGLPISYHAAKYGVDIDLLTRGAGFGYLGSTITSLIYASFTFIFFAIEAAILAMALKALFGIPVTIGYVICALAVIPIVTHGITFISKFQLGTQPIWLALQCLGLFAVVYFEVDNIAQWTHYQGIEQAPNAPSGGFNLLLFGAASSVLFAMVAQIGEQVDYLRFLPPKEKTSPLRWWSALIIAGPGWIFIGIIKMLAGSFLAYLAFTGGASLELATDPTHMYQMAFNYVTNSPNAALIMAAVMVIISQMKINVTNAYAGSIAWSNFFSRLTHSHPGRVVWLIFNVAIALLLMELGIYRALESILGMFAIIAVSWLGTLSADLLINKSLGLSPSYVEFKRAHLYDINPVGVGSMIVASMVGICCYLDVFGYEAKALAHFVTLGVTFLATPLIAYATGGKYYIARPSSELITSTSEHQCCICENSFESEDMTHCPAYQGIICSLCCSLDARCLDNCKPEARFSSQVIGMLSKFLPASIVDLIKSQFGHFLAILSSISLITAGSFWLIYYHMAPQNPAISALLIDLFIILFFILLIIFGVLSWLFLLAHESRLVAQEEGNKQTHRLIEEIEAHKETDLALQDAKDLAEAANQAKSRYLTGISHELRTPLQSILGYAQLLSRDPTIPAERKESIAIMHRSGEYLADLIEGLLDLSKIEASKLDIYPAQVDLHELLAQMVHIFGQQAEAKSITFNYEASSKLPQYVRTDEKRLRQILINVISNAVKFTRQGSVSFEVQYRNQVAEFTVTDTGVGIDDQDIERIFSPFERIRKTGTPNVPGTGLGLTIVKLLCDIMGGDIKVTSTPDQGTCFKIMLMLSSVDAPTLPEPKAKLAIGYQGIQKKILIVDDEANHRGLIRDFLTPLGFDVLEAQDAEACLNALDQYQPDVFLIDVSMPGMNGLELADHLRKNGYKTPIIMISGDAQERHIQPDAHFSHNAYMVKPIKLQSLQDHLHSLVGIDWIYEKTDNPPAPPSFTHNNCEAIPNHPLFDQLIAYAEIGYTKGVKEIIKKLQADNSIDCSLVAHLEQLSKQQLHNKIVAILQEKTL
jgi:signal transduction histidine kinase/CheY-like chemotaxis protein/purine-cytosine permease-like protein